MQCIIFLLRKLHIHNAYIIRLRGRVTMDMDTNEVLEVNILEACFLQEYICLCKAQCACLLLDIFCLGPLEGQILS